MKRRLNNIFRKDGKSVVLAMDHGNGLNVLPELNDTGEILKKCVEGGIDAILTTYGIATTFQEELGNIGLILRIDGGTSYLAKTYDKSMEVIYSIEDAIRVGADAVLCMGFPGASNEDVTLKGLARLVSEATRWNFVVGAEMLPRGFEGDDDARTPENIASACRIGVELGADFIKTDYTGDIESFKKVVEGCYKPVLVLGGGATKSEKDLLQMIKEAMTAGAKGVIIGRNIWRHETPDKLVKAIVAIVHEDADVEEALKLL
ncbi:class I fructose-bisphosphate aldolase [Tepidimicrobium xylanilyticum]|uniref:Fructose-bisphosphate aldolase, class I n=1 Tax=Tepidimicrobium xylanilyticum TaxID=1123352 RepID=A0A1H2RCX5_9FIRM|nr:deoxyribose-phosphate aldolase [Tepidimicrobium xylanilyticum]GMG95456.1 aldolase [Tepidimicrobium xylanilyticum]SDW17333.1 fructose-bisphosphate aldolase, class I [Tepidimicrobium xylanilyticum]